MFRPRVIPVLLLRNLGLVKTVKFKSPTYIGDPMNAIKIFNDLEADELVFLDITATLENRLVSVDLIRRISSEAYMPFSVGGGIRQLDDVKQIINAGAEKVIINSACFSNPGLIEAAASYIGSQSVVASVDVKKQFFGGEKVVIKSGTQPITRDVEKYVKSLVNAGAGEIIINSIDHEGTMSGYHVELVKKIVAAVEVPVVALGGAGSLADMANVLHKSNASAVAAGSFFVYHGPRKAVLINYPAKEEIISTFGLPYN